MTRALILATDGASPLQLLYAGYRLREDGVVVDVATGIGGTIRLDDDVSWDGVHSFAELADPADIAILLAGPDPASLHDETALAWLRDHRDRSGITAALGNAVPVLGELAAIEGRTVTGPAHLRDRIEEHGGTWTGEGVSVDGTVVTGRDTTALPYFMAAVRSDHAIPQDAAAAVAVRGVGDRPRWVG